MESPLSHTRDDLEQLPRALAAFDPTFVDSLEAALIVIDRKHRILLANKFAQQWLKRSAEEMRGQFCYRLVHVAEEVCADCPSAITFRTGESASTIHTSLDGEGEITYAHITTHPIKNKRGRVTHVIEYAVDVSERMRSEQRILDQNKRLAESEETYRTMVENSNDIIWTLDLAGAFIWGNRRGEEITGHRMEEWIGKSFVPLIVPEDLPLVQQVFAHTLAGRPRSYEVRVYKKDGGVVVLLVNTSPIYSNGKVIGTVSFGKDITDRKQAEDERARLASEQAARAEAEAGRQRIEEYIHTISHDLRNPLATVCGRAQMLERSLREAQGSPSSDRHLGNVTAILTATKRMNAMIQDLVDSARLESGQLHLDVQPVDLELFVPELLRRATDVLDAGRVRLEMAGDCPPVSADPDRLERILLNLLTNALKYSEQETKVLVEVKRANGEAVISLADRGIGIATADQSHIFERFYRAGGAAKAGGLGLGLYITRMLVEAHGGRIWVESEPSVGSTFFFSLPLTGPRV